MATLRETLKTTCANDAALSASFANHWFIADTMPKGGVTLDDAPKASNGVTLLPFGVIRLKASNMVAPTISGENGAVEMYLYQYRGFDVIEPGVKRLLALFHRTNLYPDDRSAVYLQATYTSDPLPDPDMDYAAMQFVRFSVSQIR